MTGTGTQTDPYIVSTWEDFKTALTTTDAYVQLGADIDMNEEAPTGISAISVSAKELDGKNYTIKNLVANGGFLSMGKSYQVLNISNLKILNFVNRGTNEFIHLGNYCNLYFYHCVISGVNESTNNLIYTSGSRYSSYVYFKSTAEGGCTLNINVCSGRFIYGEISATDSYIKSSGEYSGSKASWTLNNCYVDGVCSFEYISGYNSVIDAEFYKFNNNYAFNNGCSNLLINKDKFTRSFDKETGVKRVTTEQLTDENYLKSIGFPIGVE